MFDQIQTSFYSPTKMLENTMNYKFEMTPELEKIASQMIFSPEALSDDERFYLGKDYKLNPYDVMCGRGKGSLNNPGNKRFRAVIAQYVDTYFGKSRNDKGGTVETIIDIVRSQGGHFVKQDAKTKEWHDIGDDAAASKIGHAFRDAKSNRPSENRQKKRKSLDKIRDLKRDDMQELFRSLSDSAVLVPPSQTDDDSLELQAFASSLVNLSSQDLSMFPFL